MIDVLANDEVNNPFPETPLRVVDIRGLDGSNLPDGVTVTPSADRSRLTVTIAKSAAPIDTNLQYQVADATDDPDRMVWGNVTISVQDVPDPVTNLHVTEFGDRMLKVAWTPGQFNNSPITEYQVTVANASDGSTLSTTSCTTTAGCAVSTPGNGPSNARADQRHRGQRHRRLRARRDARDRSGRTSSRRRPSGSRPRRSTTASG